MTKILYISNARLPTEKAHGLQIMETCSALSEHGVPLTLVVPRRVNPIEGDIFEYYSKEENFAIKKIFSVDLMFLPIFKPITFIIQSLSFALSSIFFVLFRTKKEIIYTRDFIVALLMFKFSRPLFYEIHNISDKNMWLHRFVWSRVSGLIAISEGLKDDLIKNGVSTDKILIARDGVDIKRFDIPITRQEARKMLSLPENKKIVVYTGHLYGWKGADTLAKAASKLGELCEVYLVGGTEEDVQSFRKKYVSQNLHIVGQRPYQEIPLWLKAADILVLPNSSKERISRQYTSPVKLFEYMASGTPIIASELPSLKEVLTEKIAFFFVPDAAASLMSAINEVILLHYDSALEKANAAKKESLKYSWQERAKKILDFMHFRNKGLEICD